MIHQKHLIFLDDAPGEVPEKLLLAELEPEDLLEPVLISLGARLARIAKSGTKVWDLRTYGD